MEEPLTSTNLQNVGAIKRGKVRDSYFIDDETVLMIATDRLSAYNKIMKSPIPDKGKILTQMSAFWFSFLKEIVPNHLITMDVFKYPWVCDPYRNILRGRSMLVKRAEVIPFECVVRGYITGSGWESYQKDRTVCGILLPPGLQEAQKLPEPIFTPTRKSKDDEPITFDEMAKEAGQKMATELHDLSLTMFKKAFDYAWERGIILADTKFEFGIFDGKIILIDEVLTPDSSRFWPRETYQIGSSPTSLDKQYIRNYLKSTGWKSSDGSPELPWDIVYKTREKYMEAFKMITGKDFK